MNNEVQRQKRIFLICPVRKITETQQETIDSIVKSLEEYGIGVYVPYRDTNQIDPSGGYKICQDNLQAIKDADEVYVFYDGSSQGIHFDLGMAFALGKPIKWINSDEFKNDVQESGKSFLKVIEKWQDDEY